MVRTVRTGAAAAGVISAVGLMIWIIIHGSGLPPVISAGPTVGQFPWDPQILQPGSDLFLPDFSYAGFMWGEQDLPVLQTTVDVTNFGAIPDDDTDDTEAIQRAIDFTTRDSGTVVLRLPPGRFLLSDILFIERGHFVLQGSGPGEGGTVLAAHEPLNGIQNEKARRLLDDLQRYLIENGLRELWRPYSLYSWAGGLIWTHVPEEPGGRQRLTSILGGRRNGHRISVESTSGISAGDVVEVQWFNTEGETSSLLRHVLGDYDLPIGRRLFESPDQPLITQPVTVVQSEKGVVYTKEPLLHDLKPEWKPVLSSVSFLEYIGIENLRIEFPESDYAGHHLEEGFNGLYLTDLAHSWVRDVTVHNSDTALLTTNSRNISVDGLMTTGREGHHSVWLGDVYGILMTNFRFEADARHNPSFNTKSRLSVFSGGFIRSVHLDQHGGLNHQNLFDDIRGGASGSSITCGGSAYWNPDAGLYNTFWNIRLSGSLSNGYLGSCGHAAEARIVGVTWESSELSLRYGPATYVEGLNRPGITVRSLYRNQLERRLAAEQTSAGGEG